MANAKKCPECGFVGTYAPAALTICDGCGEVLAEQWALQEAVTNRDAGERNSVEKFRQDRPDQAAELNPSGDLPPGFVGPSKGSVDELLSALGMRSEEPTSRAVRAIASEPAQPAALAADLAVFAPRPSQAPPPLFSPPLIARPTQGRVMPSGERPPPPPFAVAPRVPPARPTSSGVEAAPVFAPFVKAQREVSTRPVGRPPPMDPTAPSTPVDDAKTEVERQLFDVVSGDIIAPAMHKEIPSLNAPPADRPEPTMLVARDRRPSMAGSDPVNLHVMLVNDQVQLTVTSLVQDDGATVRKDMLDGKLVLAVSGLTPGATRRLAFRLDQIGIPSKEPEKPREIPNFSATTTLPPPPSKVSKGLLIVLIVGVVAVGAIVAMLFNR